MIIQYKLLTYLIHIVTMYHESKFCVLMNLKYIYIFFFLSFKHWCLYSDRTWDWVTEEAGFPTWKVLCHLLPMPYVNELELENMGSEHSMEIPGESLRVSLILSFIYSFIHTFPGSFFVHVLLFHWIAYTDKTDLFYP